MIARIVLVSIVCIATGALISDNGTTSTAKAEPAASLGKPELGTFGFDTAGMDRSVAPGDSFAGFANGGWTRDTEIPADRAAYGMFTRLDELSKARTRAIIEEASRTNSVAGSESQQIGNFFASFMDEPAIEAKGAAPLQPRLDQIAAVKSATDLARLMGELEQTDATAAFDCYIGQDAKQPDRYIPIFSQSGLGMPDRDYYLVDNPKFVDARAKYQTHIAKMLTLVGVPADLSAARAKSIYDLEHKLAEIHWSRVESRDDDKTYNKMTKAQLAAAAPGFDWNVYFQAVGLGKPDELIVSQPSAFAGTAKLLADVPLETWKDYLTLRVTKDAAPFLSKAFVEENFAFNGTVLSGQPENQPRWKRGVVFTNGLLGEAVGKLYVAKHFPPEAKAKADELVKNVIGAMDNRLAHLTWMTPETRTKARAKLATFTPKIGYPVRWRNYSSLQIVKGDAYGNFERAKRFEFQRNLNKLGQPVDRDEWLMVPMTVNAYANPPMNEIVFPAAILQPPFFDVNADPAVNYGGIGAVIGHEISHHFDDQGRKYDAQGRLTDWWTPEDVKQFKVYTDQVVQQYSQYEPLPGLKVNGELTLGENIADLAGVTVAYDAYKMSLGGKTAPDLDGFTGDQRFFLGWAQSWRSKYRDEMIQQAIVSDPHTPGHFRPEVVRNLDAWYTAFGAKPGQKLYLAPEKRVKVW